MSYKIDKSSKQRVLKNYIWEFIISLKCKFIPCKRISFTSIYSMIDGRVAHHGGYTDRMKGIISSYCIAKELSLPFKIIWNMPFDLQRYLIPNTYNWLSEKKYVPDIFNDKVLYIVGEDYSERLLNIGKKKNINYCIYNNINAVSFINEKYQKKYNWGDLYKELFKPSDYLQQFINKEVSKLGNNYISVVFRFQQLLGDLKEDGYKILASNDAKIVLINSCIKELFEIYIQNVDIKILVTSDSNLFLSKVKNFSLFHVAEGKMVHIDYINKREIEIENDCYVKTFIDFYLLSNSKMIYSIVIDDMYPTDFPLYASYINNIPFNRIIIKSQLS